MKKGVACRCFRMVHDPASSESHNHEPLECKIVGASNEDWMVHSLVGGCSSRC